MKRLFAIVCASVGALLNACSEQTAGSTFETENTVAISVVHLDGTPAAKSLLRIREQNFLNLSSADSGEVFETDSLGVFRTESLLPGDYAVEARDSAADEKGFQKFSVPVSIPGSPTSVSVTTDAPASFAGTFETEKSPVKILIPGTDYSAEVDSAGRFEFLSVPRGVLEWTAIYAADTKLVELAAGTVEISSDTEEVSFADTATRAFLWEDFEAGLSNWYHSTSEYASAAISLDSSESDRGYSAHFTCENDSATNWALLGRSFERAVDMSELDSVALLIRGNINGEISFAFDVIADSTDAYESGKAWMHFSIDSAWTRYVITPEALLEADSIGGNIGWENVRDHVTNISIFGGRGGELWVDDITFYGVEF